MPLIPPLKVDATLSAVWTHERVVYEVRTVTNELDNERVQDSNIRNHINIALSHIADLLNLARNPTYGITWEAILDFDGTGSPPPGRPPIPYIDLTTPLNLEVRSTPWTTILPTLYQFPPYALLWEITRVGYSSSSGGIHNCQKLSQEEILHLCTGTNIQAYETVSWNHYGGSIYLWIGPHAAPPNRFWIFGYRNPILDDLRDPNSSTTWRQPIDLPDRYMRLLLLIVQKMVLEQVNKMVDSNIDMSIQQMTAQITNQIVQESQFSELQRIKGEYGLKTR